MKAVGIDLGGTKLFFGTVDEKGNLDQIQRILTPGTWKEMKHQIVDIVNQYRDQFEISSVGFGVAGMIDRQGFAHYSPNVRAFDGGVAVKDELEDAFQLPVAVDNDNNCAGYAEVHFGQAHLYKSALFVGLGTGIGGAIIYDGRILRGAHGFAAEIGHFRLDRNGPKCACGKYGCFEALASGSALGALARSYIEKGEADSIKDYAKDSDLVTGIHVGECANNGDKAALKIIDEYAKNLALGINSLVAVLDPGVIIVGGGVSSIGDVLFEPLNKYYHEDIEGGLTENVAPIIQASLGEKAGVIGAGALALSKLH